MAPGKSSSLLLLALTLFASIASAANTTASLPTLKTWWQPTGEINTKTPVQDGNVRQSHLYSVQVATAATPSIYYNSFVYETIPRNGNGQICIPGDPQLNLQHR
jgi:hypothetical protein